jgi:osmotically-inducible protein OsmY
MPITATPMVKSDVRIRADVISEIEWDPYIRDIPVKVSADSGVVTVTGQAPSLAARISLVDAVHRAYLPDERIACTVSGGVVTLRGAVDTWAHRGDAERAVARIAGVRQVVNRLTVETRPVDPAAIRLQIERALERRAEREARKITVAVKDGTVTLSGTVQSWADRNAVERVAGSAAGVTGIDDRLVVDPYS